MTLYIIYTELSIDIPDPANPWLLPTDGRLFRCACFVQQETIAATANSIGNTSRSGRTTGSTLYHHGDTSNNYKWYSGVHYIAMYMPSNIAIIPCYRHVK